MDIAVNYALDNAEVIAEKIIDVVQDLIAAYNGVSDDADKL